MFFCLSDDVLSFEEFPFWPWWKRVEYILALRWSSRRSPLYWGYIPTSLSFFSTNYLHCKAGSSHSSQTSAFSDLKLRCILLICQDTGSCRISWCSWTQLVKACTGSPHLHSKKWNRQCKGFVSCGRHTDIFYFLYGYLYISGKYFGQRWISPKSCSFSNTVKVPISFTQKAHITKQVGIDSCVWNQWSSNIFQKHDSDYALKFL